MKLLVIHTSSLDSIILDAGMRREKNNPENPFELTRSLESAHEKHLNKLLLFVERLRMATPIALAHRQRVRPLFKRSTSTQLIKYRYNALCGNANWIHVGHAARCVHVTCMLAFAHACRKKCTTDIMVRDAL